MPGREAAGETPAAPDAAAGAAGETPAPRILVAAAEAQGERLDRFLARELAAADLSNPSRVQIQDWIRGGAVSVDGALCRRAAWRLRGGERIAVAPPAGPAAGGRATAMLGLAPLDLALDLVYEDADLAVVNKPAGLMVHPGAGGRGPTLAAVLVARFGAGGLSAGGGPDRPGIVHRLDRDTSGLLVVAKNDAAHRRLAAAFQARQVRKHYLGLAHGRVRDESGRVDLPIARDLRRRARMTTRRAAAPGRKDVREAHTVFQVLARFPAGPIQPGAAGGTPAPWPGAGTPAPRLPAEACATISYTYLDIEILTGRTHQIRVHMAALGHPIVGDRLYGAPAKLAGPVAGRELGRLFLHAARLAFAHPRTGEAMEFRAPLPAELGALLEALR